MSNPTTRRFFLGAATAAAATRVWGANDKANIGIVGGLLLLLQHVR